MNDLNWNIDELVGKIMADLRGSSVESSAAKASAALTHDFTSLHAQSAVVEPAEPKEEKKDKDVFSVSERVIVEETVDKIAQTTTSKRWSLRKGAVVTPSAKDRMKTLGVEIVVDAPAETAATSDRFTLSASNVAFGAAKAESGAKAAPVQAKQKQASQRVLVATHLPSAERFPVSVREYLARNAETTDLRLDCLKETSKQIAEALGKDKSLKVVLATHDAAIGSIWANRLSGVRAVVAYTFEQAKRDITATNANVVIVDPRDVGPYPFRQIVDYFIH